MFIWSDIILNKIPEKVINTTIFTKTGEYRCNAEIIENNLITSNTAINGNIPGIYYLSELNFEKFNNNVDLFDFLIVKYKNKINLVDYSGDIIEFKNFEIYKNYIENYHSNKTTRFFNKIYINHEGNLIKESIIPMYNHLIMKEQNWYKLISENDLCKKLIPKIYNYR